MTKYKTVLLGSAIILFCSCAAPVKNFSPVFLKDKPRLKILKSPSLDNIQLETFSLIPVSCLRKEPLIKNDMLEMQLLFFLRNAFEIRGYRYVPMNEHPDMVATIDGVILDEKGYLPPKALLSPGGFSEQALADPEKPLASQNLYNCASTKLHRPGSFNAKMPLTTHTQGSVQSKTYADSPSPPPSGPFYPAIRIDILEPDLLNPLWAGIGTGTAKNSDLRLSSQTIAIFLLGEFPKGPLSFDYLMGTFGFGFFVFTNNGKDYYPTVFKVIEDSPAHKAGLRVYDMISSIDGISVKNSPFSEILRIFQKEPGRKKSVVVTRVGEQIPLEISAQSWR